MTIESEENREILEGINFGDGEEMPEEAPPEATPPEKPEVAPEPDPEPDPVSASEEKASAIGWRPKDQWKGDPDKWVDADAFLKKGDEILPVGTRVTPPVVGMLAFLGRNSVAVGRRPRVTVITMGD